ncbi:MAG: class I SAM-dependent methyltransferase [Treponema sp.]|jgi:SAM-dependent methyltransferase|nr:class I SAM-dependent methyltransferase [Treponema sp.]
MRPEARRVLKTWSTPVRRENSSVIPCALCGTLSFKRRLSCEGFFYVRCARCGLVQMNPQPEKTAVAERYQTGHGEDYLSYELANEGPFLRLQELGLKDGGFGGIEEELKEKTTRPRVLDIGCATGALLEKLRDRGWDCTGVEISPSAEYARRERSLNVLGLPLEDCRFPPASFHLVLASHLIEHLNDPAGFVEEVRRILAPGAYFLVTTPNIAGLQARLFGGRWRSAIFDHLYLFSVKTLSRLLKDRGFEIQRVCTWGGLAAGLAPRPLKNLADKTAKKFGFGDVMLIRARKRQP